LIHGEEAVPKALRAKILLVCCALLFGFGEAGAAEPIKLGFSMALTGGNASIGKQILAAVQIWRDDVNAKGGLLGRPVELVYYDDQTNAATVPGIYAKLLDVDKVDLLVGPYATNMVTPAIPVIMQHGMVTLGIAANAANSRFHYPKYFSMIPSGPEPKLSFSKGFLALAAAQNPRPKTLAIVGADSEYALNAIDGARETAKTFGFDIVYDRTYPPSNMDFVPTLRAVKAANPEVLYVASYPPDSVGIIRAANEIGLDVKMFGGAMIGPSITAIAMQLGPLVNGLVVLDTSWPARNGVTPGVVELTRKYQAIAPGLGIDPLGFTFPPFGYAACEVLAEAVMATNGLDHDKIGDYIRTHSFKTVVGEIKFGPDGEWDKADMAFTQFQNVSGHDLEQFRNPAHVPVLWPPEHKTGELLYPYSKARQ
jgi:branched-chain amino acid transport system substrate-binding protein